MFLFQAILKDYHRELEILSQCYPFEPILTPQDLPIVSFFEALQVLKV
jgi:hypothetical protein